MSETRTSNPDLRSAAAAAADVTLVERIARGDPAAFRRLYDKYYHPLLRFIWRITGRMDSAEEGVNDVMLVVWRTSARFEGRAKVSTWLMGIAYRKALRLVEGQGRWSKRFKAGGADESIERLADAREHTADTELGDWLEQGLKALSPAQRAVVELTYFYGLSYEEIAAVLDCPVNTVKTRMFHARAKLHRVLPAAADGKSRE